MNTTSPRSVGQWLWQSQEMKRHRTQLQATPAAHREFLERARVAFAQAERLGNEPPYNQRPQLPALALRLYGEAIYWSLTALVHRQEGLNVDFLPPQDLAAALERTSLSDGQSPQPPLSPELSTWLTQLVPGALSAPTSLDETAQAELARVARQFLSQADSAARGVERIWFERAQRIFFPLLVSVVLALGVRTYLDWNRISVETTFPWRASSSSGEPGCRSPRQGCEQDHFFFHTRFENEPWIEFDVSSIKTVSHVIVTNRTDCFECSTRAVPLVLEVAGRDRKFQRVATRNDDFAVWDAAFARTNAQYLRLRSTRRTHLHLKQVRIQP